MDYRIEQLRYLLREDPSSRIFFQLGELLRREGEAAEAVRVLDSGLERHPRYVAAWVSLGRSHRDLEELAEAGKAFATALEIDRENPVAARLLGETAVEREDWLGAVKALKLTRALAGGDDELDALIARVETRLDEDGRLERADEKPLRPEPPARSLEVVSFSGDDPFSDAPDETDTTELTSDVFDLSEIAQDADDAATAGDDETPVAQDNAAVAVREEEPIVDGEVPEDVAAAALPETEVAEVEDAAGDDEAAGEDTEAAAGSDSLAAGLVEEGSVGAWSSAMAAAGVPAAEAWDEPSGEFHIGDHDDAIAEPWSEPAVGIETSSVAAEAVAEPAPEPPPVEVVEATDETTVDDLAEAPVGDDDAEPADAQDDDVLPGEDRGSGAVEVTRPIAVDPELSEDRPSADTAPETAGAEPDEAADDEPGGDEAGDGGVRHELDHGVPLPTMTLARLAFEQNDRPLAVATLESLLDRDPANAEAIAMLDELKAQEDTIAQQKLRAAQATTKIAALQGWLDAVRLAAERRVQ